MENEAITDALREADIYNEDGEQIVDFENRNRDSQDFANVSRGQLREMLISAFRAGQNSK